MLGSHSRHPIQTQGLNSAASLPISTGSDSKHTPPTKIHSIIQKVQEIKTNYLTTEFVKEKATNAIIAKFRPLSNPPGWEDKMKIAKKDLKRHQILRAKIDENISFLGKAIADYERKTNTSGEKKLLQLQEKLVEATERQKILSSKINKSKIYVDFLMKQKSSQINTRLANLTGSLVNYLLPGLGTILGLSYTASATLFQEKIARQLPADLSVTTKEKKSVRLGTVATIIVSISSIIFSYYALPSIKENASHLIKHYT